MLSDATYRDWTTSFGASGYFVGDWSQGSKMQFLAKDAETGSEMGMVARIAENRAPEFVSIEHLGVIKDGVEDTTGEEARKWAPAFENYTFSENDGGTELVIDQDIQDEYKEMFEEMWDKALLRLKELCE